MVDTEPLQLQANATAPNVGRLRRALRRWLVDVLDDPDAVDALTLAASEALENAVEHAFADRPDPGTMTVTAREDRDVSPRRVVVAVADDGRWQAPDPRPGYRSRGLALIDRLADAHTVRTARAGTTVVLHHDLAGDAGNGPRG